MDGLCVRAGVNGLIGPVKPGNSGPNTGPNQCPPAILKSSPATLNSISSDKTTSLSSKFSSFNYPLKSLFSGGSKKGVALNDAVLVEEEGGSDRGQNSNWVLKTLHVRSIWEGKKGKCDQGQNGNFDDNGYDGFDDVCDGCRVIDDDDEKVEEFDRETFKKLLKKVSLNQAKLYAQMSYLGELAYDIPTIKPGNLLKPQSLRYVTSSIEKKEQLAEAEKKEQLVNSDAESLEGGQIEAVNEDDKKNDVRKSAAYQIVVSAAAFLHSRTRVIFPSRLSKDEECRETSKSNPSDDNHSINSDMASLMATTDSVTAVVAAQEEVKQAVADDLNSIRSAPCEWFVCDDDKSVTRFFVIQGSETLASWQANLLFEPMQFEGLDVFVHRGIYEAAKGMYQQMLSEVQAYMKIHGRRAKFRFTGHSLGGSLSLLINLMLLIRGEVPYASLLPVITFGSPCVMCGGDDLLRTMGLPKSHVQAIVMHRDIVPRAFSCNYPRPAAQLLKALNKSFRNHPCLNSQKQLYAPVGELLILQPDSKYSPQHDFLPSGSGLYLITCNLADASETEQQLRAAKNAFLNRPHPLQILTDRSSYGKGGNIRRDHDMNSYLKCVRAVVCQELSRIRRTERERLGKFFWWHLSTHVMETGTIIGPTVASSSQGRGQFIFGGALRTGRESLKRFGRLVASQHMHLLVVLLFPARLLIIGACNMIPW